MSALGGQAKGSTMAISEREVDPRDAGRMSKCDKLKFTT